MIEPLLSEISRVGRAEHRLTAEDGGEVVPPGLPPEMLRSDLDLPEVPENEVVRHFTHLSHLNYGVDSGFYPLGSCTMKYNPKVCERVAALPGFAGIHPYQPEETVQGALQLMYELQTALGEITGLRAVTLQPAAGAQGEFTGILMVRAYHQARGDSERTRVLVPDSAHGTNPATATMCGFTTVPVRSDPRGNVDLRALREVADDRTAALMLTMPNTLGLFDEQVLEVSRIVHGCGALMYGDGANLNALMGTVRPSDLGFDVMHVNLHKTFATPHGGGGPGSGPVVAREFLAEFLPVPVVTRESGGTYSLRHDLPNSIGRVKSFYGNFGVFVKAYSYIRALGAEGVRKVGEAAILNANYLRVRLQEAYDLPYPRPCMHEFVLSGSRQKAMGVHTLDIAKRLIDFGYHPPTIYFPLIVDEALMIEPTETETKETLDAFAEAMLAIAREAEERPEILKAAPTTTSVGRLDATLAARQPRLHW